MYAVLAHGYHTAATPQQHRTPHIFIVTTPETNIQLDRTTTAAEPNLALTGVSSSQGARTYVLPVLSRGRPTSRPEPLCSTGEGQHILHAFSRSGELTLCFFMSEWYMPIYTLYTSLMYATYTPRVWTWGYQGLACPRFPFILEGLCTCLLIVCIVYVYMSTQPRVIELQAGYLVVPPAEINGIHNILTRTNSSWDV